MANKRGAADQLTDRNWNQEDDEPEEAGHFKHANPNEINKRVIKKAKRHGGRSETSSGFSTFQGFGSPFPGSASTPMTTSTVFTGFKASETESSTGTNETATFDPQYYKQLETLNQGVCKWISTHVTLDPFVDLSPVFNDYNKHMANIDAKFRLKDTKVQDTRTATKAINDVSSKDQPSFAGFPTPASSFMTTTTNINGGASSSPVKNKENEASDSASTSHEDAPKTDSNVRSSPEEGAFYSTRCKLFFKRADSWSDLGVGMLSLKKVENKTLVLLRNDTALGKILLNIFLGEATPISRSGKNNVILMSIPNPPVFTKNTDGDNAKPVSYLIRVKTSENADDLFKQMETNRIPL